MLDELRRAAMEVEGGIAAGPILPSVTPQEIRSHLARYDFSQPVSLDDLFDDVRRMLRDWHVQVTHPRYFGLFNPSVTFASIVADTLVAMYNPQLATWRTSPAANEMERHTLEWLRTRIGLPETAVANFTTGGAEANLSAVIAALTRAFPAYSEHGLRFLPAQPAIYLSCEAHHSFNKIAHMTGLGRGALRRIQTTADLKMDLAHLASRVAHDRSNGLAPFMVVGTAGTTAAGAIDPLPDLVRFCRTEGLWLHVDAAWGGAAAISPALRIHLAGIGEADSVTCDAHKWFSVPMGAGMFFCRHRQAVRQAFHAETSYMPAETEGPLADPYTATVQWSRRFIGLKLFLALAERGEAGYVEMIESQARLGNLLRELLVRSGWRIVNSTPLPLVCFTRDGLDTASFLHELHRRQIAWMSEVRLGGGAPVLRACVTSFRTTESDVREVVRQMTALAAASPRDWTAPAASGSK